MGSLEMQIDVLLCVPSPRPVQDYSLQYLILVLNDTGSGVSMASLGKLFHCNGLLTLS